MTNKEIIKYDKLRLPARAGEVYLVIRKRVNDRYNR